MFPPTALNIISEILKISHKIYQKGYVVGNSGNISGRIDNDHIIIKRTGVSLGDLRPKDLIITRLDRAESHVSSDFFIHKEIYLRSPYAKYIVHAHPENVVIGSLKNGKIVPRTYEGKKLFGEVIPVIRCKHEELPYVINFNKHNGLIIEEGHGVYLYGEELEKLFIILEELEYTAKMSLI